MNVLDLYTRLYASLHNRRHIHYRLLSPFRFMIRKLANLQIPNYLSKPDNRQSNQKCDVIVSFTSFPNRINYVWQVVECMKRQTFTPRKILLWLSREQFPSVDSLPDSLRHREDDLFEIHFVDDDIRSHKKYYYAVQRFPQKYIFLIDDDLYYPTDIIERVWKEHIKHPKAVICNYGYSMKYDHEGRLLPYNSWDYEYNYSSDANLFFGSGGGTLIRPSDMYCDLSNIDLALKLAPLADDIWLNTMCRLANLPIIMLRNGQILPIIIDNNKKLCDENQGESKNDKQMANVASYYAKYNIY